MIAILLVSFLICLAIGLPIALVMGVSSIATLLLAGGQILPGVDPLMIVPRRMFSGIDSFPLMAVPFFILAADLMTAGRITAALLNFSNTLVGHIRGGLGQVNVLVSMFFAGISGSALADAAGPGAIAMRMMRRGGYPAEYAAALSAATATIGPIIPPSIIMVIYAISDDSVTVAGLFLAGVVPGILLGLALGVANYILATRRRMGDKIPRHSWRERAVSFWKALPAIMMPVIILGGILSGFFTPTEAAAVSVVYALLVGLFVTRTLTLASLPGIFVRSGITTAAVLLIVATASIFAWLLTVGQVPQTFAALISDLDLPQGVILLLMALLILVCGLFIDTLPAVIILVPVLAPVAAQFGVDPLHFAIMLVLNLTIGMATPPVGPVLFVMSTVGRIRLEVLSRAVVPLLLAELVVLVLVIYAPSLSLTVPNLFGYTR